MDSTRAPVSIDQLLAHADWVRGLAGALCTDDASADDVAQETWLATLEHPPRTSDAPRHWLAVVTRNVARKLTRKRKSDAALERIAAEREAIPGADDVVVRAALQQRVVAAVMKLDEPYRSTLLQRFFDRLPPRAMAVAAKVPVETVKTRLKRGLELVRRDLAGEFEREGRSWRAALLMLRRLAKPAAASTVVGSIGVVLMTKAAKIAIAAAVVAIAGPTAWWMWRADGRANRLDRTVARSAPTRVAAAPVVANASEVVRTPESRPEAAPTGAAANGAVDPEATGTFRGRVVDLADQPVAGATVYVGDQREFWFKTREAFFGAVSGELLTSYPPLHAAVARSGADGSFDLAGIDRSKTWSVGAGHPSAGCGLVTPVRFAASEVDRTIDIHLEGGISFTGCCTDPDGKPMRLSMVQICVKHDEPSLRPERYEDFILRPEVHDDGSFVTMAVPFHWFTVQAWAFPASKPGTLKLEKGGFKEIRIPWTRIPDDRHEWRLDFKFERTVALTGRILTQDGGAARLATTLRAKLADAELLRSSRETLAVVALAGDPRRGPDALRHVDVDHGGISTGADYAYGTIDLDHDRYTVDRPPATARFVAVMARNEVIGVGEIAAASPGPDVPIDLALLPEEPLVRSVEFTAVSALDGKPLDNVQIDLMCYPATRIANSDVQFLMESDAQRRNPPLVHHLVLPIGTALITTYRYDCARDHLWAEIPSGDDPLELTVALTPAGKASIRGEVVDAEGKPVAEAVLRLYRKSDMKPVWEQTERMPGKSDAIGHFEMRDLSAADYVVAAAPSDEDRTPELASAAITVAARDSPESCRLVLPKGVLCTVEVSFIDGVRRGVRLRALAADGLPLIDDMNHYWREYWRNTGRVELVLPNRSTTLEFHGPAGAMKTILFDPSLSTTASIILPAN